MSRLDRELRTRRWGLYLFFVYLTIYAVFVYLSAFREDVMKTHAFGGINVAVVYGFALILLPLILALIYLRVAGSGDEPGTPS